MILTPEQSFVLNKIFNWLNGRNQPVGILSGEAGTGKTTLIRFVIRHLESQKMLFKLLAPTGRAARIISKKTDRSASTIHSEIYQLERVLVKESEGAQLELDIEDHAISFKNKQPPLQQPAIYLVDEASMINDGPTGADVMQFGTGRLLADLFTYAEVLLRRNSKTKILFIGDEYQLPPIKMDFSPALSAKHLFENYKTICATFKLGTVIRQAGESAILECARTIRSSISKGDFNSFGITPKSSVDQVIAIDSSAAIERITMNKDTSKSIVITATNKGALGYNSDIRSRLFPGMRSVQEGDILLVTKNSPLFLNGDLLRVISILGAPEVRSINRKINSVAQTFKLEFRDLVVRPIETDDNTQNQRVKIIQNLLDRPDALLSREEANSLLVDFRRRCPSLKVNTEEFTRALTIDPYFNALVVKYGYAITCHKAQGGEWDDVYIVFDRFKRDMSSFRLAYTAVTRAQSKLIAINPPEFGVSSLSKDAKAKEKIIELIKQHASPNEYEQLISYLSSNVCQDTTSIPPILSKAGTSWEPGEDNQLHAEYESKISIEKMSEIHGRSKGAIRSRLVKLGLIDPAES